MNLTKFPFTAENGRILGRWFLSKSRDESIIAPEWGRKIHLKVLDMYRKKELLLELHSRFVLLEILSKLLFAKGF